MQTIETYLKQIKTLPAGPRILRQLMILLSKADVDSDEVVQLISFDAGLTTKVLQRCNSAFSGSAQPVYTLDEAVMRLGYGQIYSLVASVIGEATLAPANEGYGFAKGELWEHSAATAIAAKAIARFHEADENVVFTAAILHDIGKLILGEFLKGNYEQVVSETERSGRSLIEVEQTLLGIDHAELGGRILEEWNFPESLVRAVRFHHNPMEAAPYERLASSICIANLVSHLAGHSHGFQSFAVRADSAPAQLLGIDSAAIESLVVETEAAFAKINARRSAA